MIPEVDHAIIPEAGHVTFCTRGGIYQVFKGFLMLIGAIVAVLLCWLVSLTAVERGPGALRQAAGMRNKATP